MPVIPDPLHPAIIHFPVVLILLGTAAACAAVLWRKHYVPALAAGLLALGALGAWAAVETGESDGGLVEDTSPQIAALLDEHQQWAERTLALAALAAVAAAISLGLFRFPRAARATSVAAALIAATASYALYQTGHRGGALVFRHGIGVSLAASPATTTNAPMPRAGEMTERD